MVGRPRRGGPASRRSFLPAPLSSHSCWTAPQGGENRQAAAFRTALRRGFRHTRRPKPEFDSDNGGAIPGFRQSDVRDDYHRFWRTGTTANPATRITVHPSAPRGEELDAGPLLGRGEQAVTGPGPARRPTGVCTVRPPAPDSRGSAAGSSPGPRGAVDCWSRRRGGSPRPGRAPGAGRGEPDSPCPCAPSPATVARSWGHDTAWNPAARAAGTAGSGAAGDRDTPVSKPRGTDRTEVGVSGSATGRGPRGGPGEGVRHSALAVRSGSPPTGRCRRPGVRKWGRSSRPC